MSHESRRRILFACLMALTFALGVWVGQSFVVERRSCLPDEITINLAQMSTIRVLADDENTYEIPKEFRNSLSIMPNRGCVDVIATHPVGTYWLVENGWHKVIVNVIHEERESR